jgi:hypothetical protein
MVSLNCTNCNNTYLRKPCEVKRSKYCSRLCQNKMIGIGVNRKKYMTDEIKEKIALTKLNGKRPSYGGLHNWVKRKRGKATICVDCGSTNQVGWANLSQQYKRDLNDFKALCRKCHTIFDMLHREERRAYTWV